MAVLEDLVVVEYATEIAGPYCTKLLADAGATVVKVEPPAGDPLRWSRPKLDSSGSALFRFLNAGKQSVVLDSCDPTDPDDPRLLDLLARADVFVESVGRPTVDHGALRTQLPSLVVVALSAYGSTGPYAGRPATPFVVEAESGAMSTRGRSDQPPIQVGGRAFEWLMGSYAAVGALAASRQARATGHGELIDCSLMEVCHIGGSGIGDLLHQLAGRPPITAPARQVELPSIEPTADGWVGVNTNTRQQFESFLLMIGRSDLLDEDESWASAATRWERMDEWNAIAHAWTLAHTTDEIVELASLLRVPVAPVSTGRTVLDHPHFAARGVWATAPDTAVTVPLPPYKIDGQRPRPATFAPALGEHQDRVHVALPQRHVRVPTGARTSPLVGVRVIDATAWWAGPSSAQVLASLGADVIHLESPTHVDGARMVGGDVARPRWWERSPMFLRSNTNKRDVTLDLASPRGRALFTALIERSDILVENFSPRVFENFGLTWEVVHAINPRLVMVRMPAFGLDGPWRDNVGFAQTMEQMTGMAWVTGHEDDQPRVPRGPCDPLAGMIAAFTMLLGLERRDRTGRGSFVEVPMVEAALNAAAEQVIEYTASGAVLTRQGNRSRDAAPQGLYACRNREEWLALSVVTDEHWRALTGALGSPEWASDPALATIDGRREAHARVDAHLATWARRHAVDDAVELLIARGVPAGQLRDVRLSSTHPQLVARAFFETLQHPVVGAHAVPGPPFRFGSVRRWYRSAAPTLGADNHDVLTELGLDARAIDELEHLGVIGTRPTGVDDAGS